MCSGGHDVWGVWGPGEGHENRQRSKQETGREIVRAPHTQLSFFFLNFILLISKDCRPEEFNYSGVAREKEKDISHDTTPYVVD